MIINFILEWSMITWELSSWFRLQDTGTVTLFYTILQVTILQHNQMDHLIKKILTSYCSFWLRLYLLKKYRSSFSSASHMFSFHQKSLYYHISHNTYDSYGFVFSGRFWSMQWVL